MQTTNNRLPSKNFKIPALAWPLTASLTAALVISLAPGCDDGIDNGSMPSQIPQEGPKGKRSDVEKAIDKARVPKENHALTKPLFETAAPEEIEKLTPDPLRLPHNDEPSIDHVALGYAALESKDTEEAIEAFRKAAFTEDSFQALFGLGVAARSAQDLDLALEALVIASEIEPFSADPLVIAARICLEMNDIQMGLTHVDRAIAREPMRPDAHNVRGRLWMAEEQYHRALLSFARAVELDPAFAWSWNNMGYVQLVTGRYEDARDSLKKATSLSPHTAYMHNNLGLAYEKLGMKHEAEVSFQEALNLRPQYVNATINLDRVANQKSAVADASKTGPKPRHDDSLEYTPGG